jgi:hypothetical protein
MKQILVEIDDRCAKDLERVAPAKKRLRAEFIRLAIRRAVDLALERSTEQAYRERPLSGQLGPGDLLGWDQNNEFAKRTAPRRARRRRIGTKSAKSAA